MRIISGKHKGKKLVTPSDAKTTRPIPDRVKMSVFNLLRGHYEGANVVDLFAGTGSIGLEAYSRGAARVLMVERDMKIARVLDRNIENLDRPVACEVFVGDALGPGVVTRCPRPLNLLFADPPYPLVRDPDGWVRMREQFMRLIDEMTFEGFAVIRTPWPFLHKAERSGVPSQKSTVRRTVVPGESRLSEPSQKSTVRRTVVPGESRPLVIDLDGAGDEDLDAYEEELSRIAGGAKYDDVDLVMDNAEGPETHVYGSMAVHLYMRKKE